MSECQDAYEKFLKNTHVCTDRGVNAWGDEVYEHSHVQAGWLGFKEAWNADKPENYDSDRQTFLGFMRQTREHLQDNKPVMAYTMLKKAEEYGRKL